MTMISLARVARTSFSTRPRSTTSTLGAIPSGSRGLCRMMLRNSSQPGPAPPCAAELDALEELSKSTNKASREAFDADDVLTSEAALQALRRKSQAVEGPQAPTTNAAASWNTFTDVDPFSGAMKTGRFI